MSVDVRERAPRAAPARLLLLLGPALVAAIAYVDPGNVAANLTAGARYGYLLVWVLVAANAIAVFVQYQSAKLGIVTGRSLPELLGERLGTTWRRAYWAQAELVAAATGIAEVIGGAIALNLLFGLPLPLGGNAIRRDLGATAIARISDVCRASIRYAVEHVDEVASALLASETRTDLVLDRAALDRYLAMYANQDTLDAPADVRRAIDELFARGRKAGLLPDTARADFA